MENFKIFRVASVQMESKNNDVTGNIERATSLIEKAVEQNAKLVLLPEFAITGYELNENIWNLAESHSGRTVNFLKELSKKHGIWLGASYLEANGEDFYNTFVLTNPDGEEDGRVWKEVAGSIETYLFKGKKSNHIIKTKFGRVGVIICYDGMMAEPLNELSKESPDLILLPHSAAEPSIIPILFPESAVQFMNNYMKSNTERFAKLFGVPCILSNKTGAWKSKVPSPYPEQNGKFLGFSAIADSDGNVVKQLDSEQDVIVSDVNLDVKRKKISVVINSYGQWAEKVSWHFKWWPLVETKGKKAYKNSELRRKKALEMSE